MQIKDIHAKSDVTECIGTLQDANCSEKHPLHHLELLCRNFYPLQIQFYSSNSHSGTTLDPRREFGALFH